MDDFTIKDGKMYEIIYVKCFLYVRVYMYHLSWCVRSGICPFDDLLL